MRGARAAIVLAAAVTAACASTPKPAAEATPSVEAPAAGARDVEFARGAVLTLPAQPGFPGPYEATQTVVARYEDRTAAFQAALAFSETEARVTLIAPSGPRILTLDWKNGAVAEDRTLLAPANLRGVDVLADIFLTMWPEETVRSALHDGVTIATDGQTRRIATADRALVEITDMSAEGFTRHTLRNLDRGYTLSITTERSR